MLCDGNTYNYGYIGSRATGSDVGDYLVVDPTGRAKHPPAFKKVFRSSTSSRLWPTALNFHAEDMPTWSRSSWLSKFSRSPSI